MTELKTADNHVIVFGMTVYDAESSRVVERTVLQVPTPFADGKPLVRCSARGTYFDINVDYLYSTREAAEAAVRERRIARLEQDCRKLEAWIDKKQREIETLRVGI